MLVKIQHWKLVFLCCHSVSGDCVLDRDLRFRVDSYLVYGDMKLPVHGFKFSVDVWWKLSKPQAILPMQYGNFFFPLSELLLHFYTNLFKILGVIQRLSVIRVLEVIVGSNVSH
ncbi:hypothetical protein O6P43_028885 [Quillaja saponaria]|uniref:Uncharacterized protein n=1 Tax=Quillaja saponaria TaxID=32244 RepID=A0AAD7KZ13_QUISA|nr:hypothetical protein O6P43_028885 [Quillaja saponaria]